jgi:hypothetical protein
MQSLKSVEQGGVVISEKMAQEAVKKPEPARQVVENRSVDREGAESRLEFGRGVRHYGEMDDGDSTDSSEMIILQRGSVGDERYWSQLGKKV